MRFTKTFKQFFNSYKSRNFFQFTKQNFAKHSLVILGFQLNTYMFSQKLFFDEQQEPTQQEKIHKEKVKGLREQKQYFVCRSIELDEGQIKSIQVEDGEGHYPIVVTRYKGKVYAVGGLCTYDGKTELKDGIVFGNKLYSPNHGCAYNIQNGEVEYAPAIDDLPRFFAEEKGGKIYVHAPKVVPKRLFPHTMPRDYNDLRKVIIIGSGASAQGCVETLRHSGYTGEIIMVTKETKYPYDKTQLSKKIKDLDYNDLQLRDSNWYEMNGVNIMFGRECVLVDKTHGSPHIKLEDGLRLEYDALVLATGSIPENREVRGWKNKENLQYLENIEDHKKLRKNLENSTNITILGANVRSLETAATIRQEYPNIKEIYIVDENEENPLTEQYGHQIGKELIQQQLKNNVWFVFNQEVSEFVGKKEKVEQLKFKNGLEINTDLVLMFPNNRIGNADWLEESNLDKFEFNDQCQIDTTYHMRSDYKRIFAVGDVACTQYFASNDRMPLNSWQLAWHSGEIAAYNILALKIPFHQIPFSQSTQYGKTLQYCGYAKYFNEVYIDGSVKDWDFVAYYSFYDEIVAAAGTPSKRNAMQIVNEAIRLEILPLLLDIKRGKENIQTLERQIRESNRSGCFRELIHEIRYEPQTKEVIWQNREKTNEFFNFWEQGLTPTENVLDREDE